jgi:hypothetical protein
MSESTRDIAINTLAINLGVSREAAWEIIKDHANAYDRRFSDPILTTDRAGQIARSMWIDETFVWTPANLSRFVRDATAQFVLMHDVYSPALDCEHPLCEQFHRKSCPEPGMRSRWYVMDRATGWRANHADDEYERKSDALAAHNFNSTMEVAR